MSEEIATKMNLRDKVVLITGGAGDMGSSFVRAFLKRESKVCICDIGIDKGRELLKETQKEFGPGRVRFFRCDVTKDEDFQGAFDECKKHLGTVDILINNAAILKETDWKKTMETNYGGVVRGCELALKRMGKHNGGKGGHVINISSVSGMLQFYIAPFYASAKSAVIHYTRCIGHEFHYNYTGVSCRSFCPYFVDTSLLKEPQKWNYNKRTQKEAEEMVKMYPKLTTDEVTEALFELLMDNQPGAAMVLEKEAKPYFPVPSVIKSVLYNSYHKPYDGGCW